MNRDMMVGKAAVALAAACLLPVCGLALPPPGQDVLGIYTADDGTGFANRNATGGSNVTVYLVATGVASTSGISGWECSLELPPNVFLLSTGYAGQAINVASPPDFAVGLTRPLVRAESMRLAALTFYVVSAAPAYFKLHPIAPNPTIPGFMVYARGDDPGAIVRFAWSSGAESWAVFGFNTGPLPHFTGGTIPVEPSSWGHVKSMYR